MGRTHWVEVGPCNYLQVPEAILVEEALGWEDNYLDKVHWLLEAEDSDCHIHHCVEDNHLSEMGVPRVATCCPLRAWEVHWSWAGNCKGSRAQKILQEAGEDAS